MEIRNLIKRMSVLSLLLVGGFSVAVMAEEADETEKANVKLSTVERTFIASGETSTVYVNMDNNVLVDAISGCITLPEGLHFVKNDDEGNKKCKLGDRIKGLIKFSTYASNEQMVKFAITGAIEGNEGTLFSFPVLADDDIPAVLDLKLTAADAAGFDEKKGDVVPYAVDEAVFQLINEDYRIEGLIEDFSISANEEKTVSFNMSNREEMSGAQCDLIFPEGLTLDTKSAKISDRLGSNYYLVASALPNNTYRFGFISLDGSQFSGDGEVLSFTVKASEDFADDAVIKITNVEGVSVDEISYYGADAVANVKYATATGINGVNGESGIDAEAIYNVNGIRTDRLTNGVNIVRKADGKVIKVIKK